MDILDVLIDLTIVITYGGFGIFGLAEVFDYLHKKKQVSQQQVSLQDAEENEYAEWDNQFDLIKRNGR